MSLEQARRKESPLYRHVSGRLVDQLELPLLREAAANTGLNLKVIASSGETYVPLYGTTERIGGPKDQEELFKATKSLEPVEVPEGKVYISLSRYSLRVHDFTLSGFDKQVKSLKGLVG